MGTVYEAEQTAPVQRRVALKVVRGGVESRDILARFESERQALAVMNHESIAKVLDAGASDDGRPYFVMELVKGIPITEYCDSRKLSTRERVELFRPVCDAVQHAHQKGVIHRDLKPSNVMVTESDGRAVPKIIDFGIAKATGAQFTERTMVTMVGQTIGTPAYMSPEQAERSGLDVDTRTDIYSLGVMLYELLVGRLPEDPAERGLQAFLARLAQRATDPPLPSHKVTTLAGDQGPIATLRSTSADHLRRELKGDLDWIVMTAMDKDRNRRYQSASGLGNDLRRYLAHEPVHARPPTATYRLQKFVRRHRIGVLAGAAVVAALLVGAGAAVTGFVRATRANERAVREAATADEVSNFLVRLFNISRPDRARGDAITAREILDSGAVRLDRELSGQPEVQARLMRTIGGVYTQLGAYAEAERLLDRSLAIRESLPGDNSAGLSSSLTSLGSLYKEQGLYPRAESTLMRAISLAGQADAEQVDLAWTLEVLSETYRGEGRFQESDSVARLRLGMLREQLGADHEDVTEQTWTLAASQAEQGKPEAAESLFRQVLASRLRADGASSTGVAAALSGLASSLFEQGRFSESDSLYRQALAIKIRTYGPDHMQAGVDHYNLGNVASEVGRFGESLKEYERAQVIFEKALGAEHPHVGAVLTARANTLTRMGRSAEAIPLLEQALVIREKSLSPDHPFIATTHHSIGVAQLELGRLASAEAHLTTALRIRERALEPTSYYIAEAQQALAELYGKTRRLSRADSLYRSALRQWEVSGREDAAEHQQKIRDALALLSREPS